MKYEVPPDFYSDGCTIKAPGRWLIVPAIIEWCLRLYFAQFAEDCRWHDWARRHLVHYGVMTVQEADAELRKLWTVRGMPRWLSRLAWNFIKLTRDKYRNTQPIPHDKPHWYDYLRGKQA